MIGEIGIIVVLFGTLVKLIHDGRRKLPEETATAVNAFSELTDRLIAESERLRREVQRLRVRVSGLERVMREHRIPIPTEEP